MSGRPTDSLTVGSMSARSRISWTTSPCWPVVTTIGANHSLSRMAWITGRSLIASGRVPRMTMILILSIAHQPGLGSTPSRPYGTRVAGCPHIDTIARTGVPDHSQSVHHGHRGPSRATHPVPLGRLADVTVAELPQRYPDQWGRATRHRLLVAIRDGELSATAFDTWLAQDYVFVGDLLAFQARL